MNLLRNICFVSYHKIVMPNGIINIDNIFYCNTLIDLICRLLTTLTSLDENMNIYIYSNISTLVRISYTCHSVEYLIVSKKSRSL